MRHQPRLLVAVAITALSGFVRADLVLTRKTHTEAHTTSSGDVQARDNTVVVWVGKDRLRLDDGERVVIVRLDAKKLHLIDPTAKVASTTDLPVDIVKLAPPEVSTMLAQMAQTMKVTSEQTTETRQFQGWNATKGLVRMSGTADATITVWVTKDLPLDRESYVELVSHAMSIRPGGAMVAAEMRKFGGVSVLTERVQTAGPTTMRSRDELVSAETKEAPPGTYDIPADYTVKPFDAMDEILRSMPRGPAPAPAAPGAKPQ
ncbi:MAG: hypothetical protein NTY35_05080 [Planctomycetota bacterium]|nr:hypothetical protein [Planctomycetota bacterium]